MNQFIAKSKNKDQRGFIMGKLFLTDSAIASEKNNPYKIPLGTVFHVCFAEPVFRGSHLIQKRATAQSPTKTEETTTEDRK